MMSFFQQNANAELDPTMFAGYQTRRRQIDDQYKTGLAANQYDQSRAGLSRAEQLRDLTTKFVRGRRTLSQGVGSRGLANSGFWQRRVADQLADRSNAFSSLESTYSDQMGRLGLARQALESNRNTQHADLDAQEAARRAEIAAMLRNNLQGFI